MPLDDATSMLLMVAAAITIGGACLLSIWMLRSAGTGFPLVTRGKGEGAAPAAMPLATGLVETDADGRITRIDPVAADLLGPVTPGMPIAGILPALATAGEGPRPDIHESALLRADGRPGDVDLMVIPNQGAGWRIAIRDAGPRRQRMRRLEQLALHDPLTGLPNRALFADRAEQAMAVAERRGESCSVLMLDLDRFKQVNDTLGHDIGDLLLRDVAPRLSLPLRRTDTLARLGGDEFAVLLPPPTSAEEAIEVARRLVRAMAAPFLIEGFSLNVGVSIGVALRPRHGADVETLLRSADEAMYAAKRDALGYLLAGEPSDLGVIRRPALRSDLERAIAEDGLSIHFQPKVEAGSRRVAGFEGLLRWDHPTYGRLQPDKFLPVAERACLMGPLTRFVLNECLRRQQEWRKAGFPLEVAVNLANFWLCDAELVDHVRHALIRWGARAEDLTLDVTEGSIMSDPARSRELLGRLRGLGCRVAMDDFGTGYSSLTQLQRLPLDEIKIHRSFVAPLEQSQGPARVVLRSIVGIAQGLGLATTAEGVESELVARSVAELGCERLQGFLVAEPMSAEAALSWLQHWDAGIMRVPAS
ncbi:putative bifunctional diguanylate cyclase/phosphodiesterase [Geminicoccus roseus]|uniref:putative bifunctional diguanylate cyclase/phosphodiesterase n=1 Tax=Geminicoccus roseus TaxID=404900 RepID=UPI0012F7FF10|nr:EAL domain-containing protein [Geminicoccus roseus]